MISWSRNVTRLLLMWLMLSMTGFNIAPAGAQVGVHKPVTVQILNALSNGLELTLDCRSKNDYLGVHKLKHYEDFEFKFRPNFWGSTLYYCRFEWKNNDHTVTVFNYRDEFNLCRQCYVKITDKQMCKFNYDTNKYDRCTDW
jgi:hypothetical protein